MRVCARQPVAMSMCPVNKKNNRPVVLVRMIIGLCMLVWFLPSPAQSPFRILEYNVENLFDCQHDRGHDDHEFLPDGDKRWNTYKYWKKLNALVKVVAAVGERRIPDLVVLCEVENDTVVRDLCQRSALRTLGYRYVVTGSEDARGIDVAVLYQPGTFRLLSCDTIRIPSREAGFPPTRDLLYLQGRLISGDTLHLVACHLPSKYSGTRAADRHRLLAASTVASVCDSILHFHSQGLLVVTGDFNASASEKLFRSELGAACGLRLLPELPLEDVRRVGGTYRYQGYWSSLDHFLVSEALCHPSSPVVLKDSVSRIADFPFLLQTDEKYGGVKPFRTYLGPRYLGGYSDHLPLWLDLLIRDDTVHCSESSSPGISVP